MTVLSYGRQFEARSVLCFDLEYDYVEIVSDHEDVGDLAVRKLALCVGRTDVRLTQPLDFCDRLAMCQNSVGFVIHAHTMGHGLCRDRAGQETAPARSMSSV